MADYSGEYIPKSLKETILIVAVVALLVGGTIWLLRWSFAVENEQYSKMIRETEAFGPQAVHGQRYKFAGKIMAKTPARLPDGTGQIVWGYFNASAEYGNYDGQVVESLFWQVALADDIYLQAGDRTLPVLFREPHNSNTATDDVYNDVKVILVPKEVISEPELQVKKIRDKPHTLQQDYLIAYGDFRHTFSPEQIKLFDLNFRIDRKYLPVGTPVVIIGTYTPEGIAGTAEEPVLIFACAEEECITRLEGAGAKM